MHGITIKPAQHLASQISHRHKPGKSNSNILDRISQTKRGEPIQRREIIQSSFQDVTGDVLPNENGFVQSAIAAYSDHHHLRIRPDDVWLAILTQLSAYINADAEELRGSLLRMRERRN